MDTKTLLPTRLYHVQPLARFRGTRGAIQMQLVGHNFLENCGVLSVIWERLQSVHLIIIPSKVFIVFFL